MIVFLHSSSQAAGAIDFCMQLASPSVFEAKQVQRLFVDVLSHIINSCFFFAFLWISTSSKLINAEKKELGQYLAMLTSRSVTRTRMCEQTTKFVPVTESARKP